VQAVALQERMKMHGFNKAIIIFSVLFLPVLALYLAERWGVLDLPVPVLSVFRFLITAIGLLLGASVFIRFTAKAFRNIFSEVDVEEKLLITKAYGFVIYSLTVLLILYLMGVGISNLTLFLGLITTGLAFAVRDILMSYFAWFMLLTKKPFRIGDYIQIKEIEGKVIHIGTFYVLLDDSPENRDDFIRIPNRIFLEHPLFNFGSRDFTYRIIYPLAEGKSIDLDKIRKALQTVSVKETSGLEWHLDSSPQGLSLVVTGKAQSFRERNHIRTQVLSALAEKVPFKS